MKYDHLHNLLSDKPLRPDVREILREGIAKHLESGEPLRKCLGINRNEHLTDLRNHHLYQAWLSLTPESSNRKRTLTLMGEIDKFMVIWREYKLPEPDPAWSKLRNHIFYALRCRVGIPGFRMMEIIIAKYHSLSIS